MYKQNNTSKNNDTEEHGSYENVDNSDLINSNRNDKINNKRILISKKKSPGIHKFYSYVNLETKDKNSIPDTLDDMINEKSHLKKNEGGPHSMQRLMTNNSLLVNKSSHSKNISKSSRKNNQKLHMGTKRLKPDHSLSPKNMVIDQSKHIWS